jgi:hypothetical protein
MDARQPSTFPLALLAISLVAAAAGFGCKKQLAQLQQLIPIPSRCPDQIPDQATGTDSPRDALGCFKQAVDKGNGNLFLRVTCRGTTSGACKQPPGAEKEAEGIVAELGKKDFGGIVAQWEENPKTTVYALAQGSNDKKVSFITVCQIAIEDRWAVCAVDEGTREQAEKREAAHQK